MIRTLVITAALGCAVLGSFATTAKAEDAAVLNAIAELDGITEQYPPFNFRDERTKAPTGITVDVLAAVFAYLGIDKDTDEIRIQPWVRGYKLAQEKPGTALFSMTYADERLKQFAFVGPVVPTRVALISKKSRRRCVQMALHMQQKAQEMDIPVRMGIDSGICTVGNFGSEEQMDYTIIGKIVNTASRLESNAEPGRILVSEAVKDLTHESFGFEANGITQLRGIERELHTYWIAS